MEKKNPGWTGVLALEKSDDPGSLQLPFPVAGATCSMSFIRSRSTWFKAHNRNPRPMAATMIHTPVPRFTFRSDTVRSRACVAWECMSATACPCHSSSLRDMRSSSSFLRVSAVREPLLLEFAPVEVVRLPRFDELEPLLLPVFFVVAIGKNVGSDQAQGVRRACRCCLEHRTRRIPDQTICLRQAMARNPRTTRPSIHDPRSRRSGDDLFVECFPRYCASSPSVSDHGTISPAGQCSRR